MPIINHKEARNKADLPPYIKAALSNNFGLTLYRLPGEQNIHLVYGSCEVKSIESLKQKNAFLIAPFNNRNGILSIEPSEVFPIEEGTHSFIPWHIREKQNEGPEKDTYKKMVRYGIEQIKAGSFDKVVLANKKHYQLPENFELLTYFYQLERTYPDAFVYLLSTPQYGTWVGATPELLLAFDHSTVQTEAIAGTKANEEEVDFGEKEKQEQNLVSQYIENCFENLAIDYEKTGPKTVEAGQLKHLKTQYESHLNGQTDEHWITLLKCLHPTPAVGGYPYNVTQIFIRNEEPFDRQLYAGFLGPVYFHEVSKLFVNLRCMEIHKEEACIYAGAGIVKGSKSEEEHQETEEKMRTLLDVLQE